MFFLSVSLLLCPYDGIFTFSNVHNSGLSLIHTSILRGTFYPKILPVEWTHEFNPIPANAFSNPFYNFHLYGHLSVERQKEKHQRFC